VFTAFVAAAELFAAAFGRFVLDSAVKPAERQER